MIQSHCKPKTNDFPSNASENIECYIYGIVFTALFILTFDGVSGWLLNHWIHFVEP